MPTLEETIRGLSPEALNLYRQQLPERLKVMGELERNTLLEQLQAMPEFRAMPAEPQEPPAWQKPLQWLRTAEQAAGAFLGAPFSPAVAGTEHLPWWEREKAEYEAWEAPSVEMGFKYPQWLGGEEVTLGVKGALELTPWFATTIATAGLGGMAGLGARTGFTTLTKAAQLGQKAIRPVIADMTTIIS